MSRRPPRVLRTAFTTSDSPRRHILALHILTLASINQLCNASCSGTATAWNDSLAEVYVATSLSLHEDAERASTLASEVREVTDINRGRATEYWIEWVLPWVLALVSPWVSSSEG